MARPPLPSGTVVATRIMSPRSFMRWKSVASAPTSSRTRSTSTLGLAASAFWPVQAPPRSSLGRTTSVTLRSSWFTAGQRTVSREKESGPMRSI